MEYNKKNPLRCFFSFEGYNSQGLALNRIKKYYPDFDCVCVGRSEIDKYAILAADALFPDAKNKNYGDIRMIDWDNVPDFDLFTMSSPCQDFSNAGLRKGGAEGSGTRSSLLWECRRAISSKMPKYILFENVKGLMSYKFLPYFRKWQNELASFGYSNFAKVINAKDFGIPQNRERIFMISILDENASYHFPEPFLLTKRIKDVLEQNVDEKFYLKASQIDYIYSTSKNGIKRIGAHDMDDVANTIISTCFKGDYMNCIKEPVACAMRGRNPEKPSDRKTGLHTEQRLEIGCPVCNTITSVQKDSLILEQNFKIRKLSPRETLRLMDVDDEDIDKIFAIGISNTQIYRMGGNSIVVSCLYHIFRKLFIEKENENKQLTLF